MSPLDDEWKEDQRVRHFWIRQNPNPHHLTMYETVNTQLAGSKEQATFKHTGTRDEKLQEWFAGEFKAYLGLCNRESRTKAQNKALNKGILDKTNFTYGEGGMHFICKGRKAMICGWKLKLNKVVVNTHDREDVLTEPCDESGEVFWIHGACACRGKDANKSLEAVWKYVTHMTASKGVKYLMLENDQSDRTLKTLANGEPNKHVWDKKGFTDLSINPMLLPVQLKPFHNAFTKRLIGPREDGANLHHRVW